MVAWQPSLAQALGSDNQVLQGTGYKIQDKIQGDIIHDKSLDQDPWKVGRRLESVFPHFQYLVVPDKQGLVDSTCIDSMVCFLKLLDSNSSGASTAGAVVVPRVPGRGAKLGRTEQLQELLDAVDETLEENEICDVINFRSLLKKNHTDLRNFLFNKRTGTVTVFEQLLAPYKDTSPPEEYVQCGVQENLTNLKALSQKFDLLVDAAKAQNVTVDNLKEKKIETTAARKEIYSLILHMERSVNTLRESRARDRAISSNETRRTRQENFKMVKPWVEAGCPQEVAQFFLNEILKQNLNVDKLSELKASACFGEKQDSPP